MGVVVPQHKKKQVSIERQKEALLKHIGQRTREIKEMMLEKTLERIEKLEVPGKRSPDTLKKDIDELCCIAEEAKKGPLLRRSINRQTVLNIEQTSTAIISDKLFQRLSTVPLASISEEERNLAIIKKMTREEKERSIIIMEQMTPAERKRYTAIVDKMMPTERNLYTKIGEKQAIIEQKQAKRLRRLSYEIEGPFRLKALAEEAGTLEEQATTLAVKISPTLPRKDQKINASLNKTAACVLF